MSTSAVTGNTSRSAAARRCCSRYTRFLSTDHGLDEIGSRDRSALRTLSYSVKILGSSKGFISDRFFPSSVNACLARSSQTLDYSRLFLFPPQYNLFFYCLDKKSDFFPNVHRTSKYSRTNELYSRLILEQPIQSQLRKKIVKYH